MVALITDKLTACLRRHNPYKVRAYLGDENHREIAVPQRRRRWAQVVEAIEAMPWSRCELLDKAGAVLGYVENDAAPTDAEDLTGHGNAVTQAERITNLVLRGMREAMQFRDAELQALTRAQGDVVREMVVGMRALTELYRAQVDTAADVAEAQAMASQGGQLKELTEAMPVILQALPLLKSLLSDGPKNGS
jgi:hypothetical protein